MERTEPCCGNCKNHIYDDDAQDWVCDCEDSEFYSDYTGYNDKCEEWEERE